LNNEEEVIKRLNQAYSRSQIDINDKIKNLTFTIGKLQQEYDWMDPDDPKRAKVKSMIQSKIYQKQYQEQLKSQVDGIMDKLLTTKFVSVSEYLDQCYTDGFIGTVFDAHGQGVPFIAPIDQEAMVNAVQLESKISKGLYTRLGEDVDLLKQKITVQVSRSIATGMSYAQTAKALENYSKIGYNNAIRIARTEGHRIQTTATMDAMKAAKDKGCDVIKQWDATLDGRTRESHSQVDGEIRELDKKFSNGLMYPGDPSGGAGEVINCRCALLQRARWALDEDELHTLQDRAAYFGLDKADEFDDFKKKYLKAVETPANVVKSITRDDFPEAFRTNAQGKKASQVFADTLNDAEDLNPNIKQLYTHIDDLPNYPGYSISYTDKGHALSFTDRKLKVPKMVGDDLNGQKGTAFHEMAHYIDMGAGKGNKLLSELKPDLTDVVARSGAKIGDKVKNILDDFGTQYKQLRDDLRKTYNIKRNALNVDVRGGKITWSDYKKQWNALTREENGLRDYLGRNLCGGGVGMLSDIYDALSGGVYQDTRVLIFGHGGKYYRDLGNRNCEIFANYMSLSVNRPDLIEMLKQDKPELCKALDELIEEMVGKIK
jgi:hypothetical protein